MPWARLDDACIGHEKALALSDSAFRLWVSMIVYSSHTKSDGRVSKAALSTFGVRGNLKRAIDELCQPCREGANPLVVIDEITGHFLLHDYTTHNLSRTRIERLQAGNNARQDKLRNGVTNAVTSIDSHGVSNVAQSIHPSNKNTEAPTAPRLVKADKAPESPIRRLQLRYAEMLALNLGVENPELNWKKVGSIFKMALEKFDEGTVRHALEKFMLDRDPFLISQAWPIGLFRPRFNQYLVKPAGVEPRPPDLKTGAQLHAESVARMLETDRRNEEQQA